MPRSYEQLRDWYAKVKPMRGTEIRPISHRRSKHKQVVQVYMGDGNYAYAAQLYSTKCVTYYPDGTFDIGNDGYGSVTTKDFITEHTPQGVYCANMKNTMWVMGPAFGDKKYPIGKQPIRFHFTKEHATPGGWIEPVKPVVVVRNMVNRSAAKEKRNTIKPFLNWVKNMLAISDGWIRHDTVTQFFPLSENKSYYMYTPPPNSPVSAGIAENVRELRELQQYYPSRWKTTDNAEKIIAFFSNLHEDDYAYGMCLVTRLTRHMLIKSRLVLAAKYEIEASPINGAAYKYQQSFHDIQLDFPELMRCFDKLVRTVSREAVMTEASNKVLDNII